NLPRVPGAHVSGEEGIRPDLDALDLHLDRFRRQDLAVNDRAVIALDPSVQPDLPYVLSFLAGLQMHLNQPCIVVLNAAGRSDAPLGRVSGNRTAVRQFEAEALAGNSIRLACRRGLAEPGQVGSPQLGR